MKYLNVKFNMIKSITKLIELVFEMVNKFWASCGEFSCGTYKPRYYPVWVTFLVQWSEEIPSTSALCLIMNANKPSTPLPPKFSSPSICQEEYRWVPAVWSSYSCNFDPAASPSPGWLNGWLGHQLSKRRSSGFISLPLCYNLPASQSPVWLNWGLWKMSIDTLPFRLSLYLSIYLSFCFLNKGKLFLQSPPT